MGGFDNPAFVLSPDSTGDYGVPGGMAQQDPSNYWATTEGGMAGGVDGSYFDPSLYTDPIPDTLGNGSGFDATTLGNDVTGMDPSGNLIYTDPNTGSTYTLDANGNPSYLSLPGDPTFSTTVADVAPTDPASGDTSLPAPAVVPTPETGVTDLSTLTGGVVPTLPDTPASPYPMIPTPPNVNTSGGLFSALQSAGSALSKALGGGGSTGGSGSGLSMGGAPKPPTSQPKPMQAGVLGGAGGGGLLNLLLIGGIVYLLARKG